MYSRFSRARTLRIALPVLLIAWACGGDPAEPNINEAFVGNWVATSFIVDGEELITPGGGLSVSFGFFSDGSYQFIVGGDVNNYFCDPATSCVDDGDYSFAGNVITLDPGTVDQLGLQYSASASTLNVSGNLDGLPFSAVFART